MANSLGSGVATEPAWKSFKPTPELNNSLIRESSLKLADEVFKPQADARNARYVRNQQLKKLAKYLGKGYTAAGKFVSNNREVISALDAAIPDTVMATNTDELITNDVGDQVANIAMTNLYTALPALGWKLGKLFGLNNTATQFGDQDTGLTFGENVGNTAAKYLLGPAASLFATKVDKVDRSLLKGSQTYTWEGPTDKYGLAGEGKNFYRVMFGGNKLNELANQEKFKISTAVGIKKQGDLDNYAGNLPATVFRTANKLNGGLNTSNIQISKSGSVLQFSKRTLSKRKYQIGGQLPKWLFYDQDKQEYVTDFYETSPKENIQELYNYVETNLPEWKVWKSPYGQKRYFILNKEEANRRDSLIAEYIKAESLKGATGKTTPEIGESIGIDDKELTYVGNLISSDGRPYNFKDASGATYYFPEYKKGGKVNVIPSGALHAHKHHLEEVDEKFEDVTTKGIPVVVESEGGNLIQLAEVEKEEIIFRLEVTKKLEEFAKEGTNEAAIKAGKLLCREILHNTDDKTGEMI